MDVFLHAMENSLASTNALVYMRQVKLINHINSITILNQFHVMREATMANNFKVNFCVILL